MMSIMTMSIIKIPLIGRAFKTQNVPGDDSDEDLVLSTLSDLMNQIDEVPSPGPTVTANDPTERGRSRPCRSSPFVQHRGDRIAVNLQFGVSLSGSAFRAHGRPINMDIGSDESSDSMSELIAYSDTDSESDAEYRSNHSRVHLCDPTIGSRTFREGQRIVAPGHLQANDSDSDDDEPIFGWAMSTQQKKSSPMKTCVFIAPEVLDLTQSDDETLIDIDTRSNEASAETIKAEDIRAGVGLNYGIMITPGQISATSGVFAMAAEHRRLVTTVPTASQTTMSLDEDISPLTPLTQDTIPIPEYIARTKTTPRRSLLLEERGLVPSTEVDLDDAKYRDCDLYSRDLRHRLIPDIDQRMARWFRVIVRVHPRGSPALAQQSQHRCNVCLGPAHGADADCAFIPLCGGCSLECDNDIKNGRCASCPFKSLFEKFDTVSDNDRSLFPIHELVPRQGLASTIVPRPLIHVHSIWPISKTE